MSNTKTPKLTLDLRGNELGLLPIEKLHEHLKGISLSVTEIDLRANGLWHLSNKDLVQFLAQIPSGVLIVRIGDLPFFENKTYKDIDQICTKIKYYSPIQRFIFGDNKDPAFSTQAIIPSGAYTLLKQAMDSIEQEIRMLQATTSQSRYVAYSMGALRASDEKVQALTTLKKLILSSKLTEFSALKDEIEEWFRSNQSILKEPQNRVHAFFEPNHTTRTASSVHKLLQILEIELEDSVSLEKPL